MKKIRFNILFRSIQGAIGKRYVVKHYGKKIVITKYPCMEFIIPSKEQRRRRNLFAEAVAWAKDIIADPIKKNAWQKKIKRKNGVYNQAIKKYLLMAKNEKKKSISNADCLINKSLHTTHNETNQSQKQEVLLPVTQMTPLVIASAKQQGINYLYERDSAINVKTKYFSAADIGNSLL